MVFDARVKRSGREVNHSSVSIAELKNAWSYTSSSPVCLHGVGRDNFSFIYIFTKVLGDGEFRENPHSGSHT